MPRALIRLAVADLKSRPLESIQLFVVLMVAATAVTAALFFNRAADALWAKFVAETNGAQVSFVSGPVAADLSPIASMEGIAESDGPYPALTRQILAQDPEKHNMTVIGFGPEPPRVDRPLVVAGRWLAPGGQDEIVLDPNFAQELGLAVGDEVTILVPTGGLRLQVVGLASSPSWPYPLRGTAPGYVLRETLPKMEAKRDLWRSVLSVRLTSPREADALISAALDGLPEGAIEVAWQLEESRELVQFWDGFSGALLAMFSLFVLTAAGLIIAYATGAAVLAQVREIGLLKAIGFTPRLVALLLLAENMILGLAAGLAGATLGVALAPLLQPADPLRQTMGQLTSNVLTDLDPLLFVIAVIVTELFVIAATLLPAWQGGRIETLRAIRTGFSQPVSRPTRLTWIASRDWLPPVIGVGLKSAVSRPGRAALTIGGLALTLSVMTVALLLESSRRAYVQEPALIGYPFDFIVERNYLTDEAAQKILRNHSEIESYVTLAYTRLQVSGTPLVLDVRAIGGDADQAELTILEGRSFSQAGEAIVGPVLLDRLGLAVWDTVQMNTLNGEPLSLRVVGTFLDADSHGQGMNIGMDTLRQVEGEVVPVEYGVKLAEGTDVSQLRFALLADSEEIFGLEVWRLPEELAQIRWPLVGLVLGLVIISLVGLFSTTRLDARERFRDFGILRALGLTPSQVILSVICGTSLLSLLALLIGIPFAVALTAVLLNYLGDLIGSGVALPMVIRWWWFFPLTMGAVFLALLGSALSAVRVSRQNVVASLRYE